jgi:hypothetical protein
MCGKKTATTRLGVVVLVSTAWAASEVTTCAASEEVSDVASEVTTWAASEVASDVASEVTTWAASEDTSEVTT